MDFERFLDWVLVSVASGDIFSYILAAIWGAFSKVWWFVVPLALFYIVIDYWTDYITLKYKQGIKWAYLEVKVPRDIVTTPKAMEQVFAGFSAIGYTPTQWEVLSRGMVPPWVAFEMAGTKDGIRFYVSVPREYKRLVETQFYSQYSQIEIREAENYTSHFSSLPDNHYNIWNVPYVFTNDSIFPIKTYDFFEDIKEEKRLDSLSSLLEILSRLEDGEEIWIQMLLRPLTVPQAKAWKEEGKKKIDEMLGKKSAPVKKPFLKALFNDILPKLEIFDVLFELIDEVVNTIMNVVFQIGSTALQQPPKKEEKKEEARVDLSLGEKKRIEEAEKKMLKPVFEAVIRVIYLAPRPVFDDATHSAAIGAYFRNFSITGLNGFAEKIKMYTGWKSLWADKFHVADQKFFFMLYNYRAIPDADTKDMLKKTILNIEELATLYHFPISSVSAPGLYRLGVKKNELPPNLPVV